MDIFSAMENKALISMLDLMDTELDQDATDELLVRKKCITIGNLSLRFF